MTNSSIITNSGKRIGLHRTYTASPTISAPTKFSVGILNGTPLVTDTALDNRVAIEDGTTNDDGSNNFTGSGGGDNSTNNTTTFKEGAGNSDVTAQNLIANNTSVTKTWTSPDLAASGADMVLTKPFATWVYILNAAALAKFKTSGTCLELRIRTNGDGATLYHELVFTVADLAVGWNFLTSGTTLVSALDTGAGGAASGDLNEFVIVATTNNSTDEFAAGDVIYDLLRQWAASDLISSFVSGYPTFDFTNNEVTIRGFINSAKANGFDLNSLALYNTDGTPLMHSEDTHTAESKSSQDEFAYIIVDRDI